MRRSGRRPGEARALFRGRSGLDDATWAGARGFTLSMAVIALRYYRETNPVFAALVRRIADATLAAT